MELGRDGDGGGASEENQLHQIKQSSVRATGRLAGPAHRRGMLRLLIRPTLLATKFIFIHYMSLLRGMGEASIETCLFHERCCYLSFLILRRYECPVRYELPTVN